MDITPGIWQKGHCGGRVCSRWIPRSPHSWTFLVPRFSPALRCACRISDFRGRWPNVGVERWFYRDESEWIAIAERLKQMACPHCKAVGTLIRHGFLYGFDEESPQEKTVRARRIFCSNRHARPGCGRTFSIWLADKIRRLSLTSRGLWTFLKRAAADGIAAAIRAADCHLSDRTLQRIWKRFDRGQSAIRTALFGRCSPPETPPEPARRPAAAHVLAHLQAAFPNADCPIAAFQHATRSFFA